LLTGHGGQEEEMKVQKGGMEKGEGYPARLGQEQTGCMEGGGGARRDEKRNHRERRNRLKVVSSEN
jgi:hypothetical protein